MAIWIAFSHPGVLKEMYVKNFVISYTVYTSYINNPQRFDQLVFIKHL